MRRLLPAALCAAALLACPAPAPAAILTPSGHAILPPQGPPPGWGKLVTQLWAARRSAWHWQAAAGMSATRASYVADRSWSRPKIRRATSWWHGLGVAARQQAQAPPPAAAAPVASAGGFPAACVAMAEESGQNSWAGYFGFIYSPSTYGFSGPSSWLDWSYSAQLRVALSLYARYGGSAWGPLTREKCGI